MERRLAAIVLADVVGYTKLIRADEVSTRVRFQALQNDLFTPAVTLHGGRVIKTMGDAFLLEFPSAVEAVSCAVEVQRELSAQEIDIAEDRRIRFRVGINLGDIIVEGDDIHGDGVNVAARLEELADPGGILISGKIHDEVGRHFDDVGFEFAGEQQVKNMPDPVATYRVLLNPTAALKKAGVGVRRPSRTIQSIVAASVLLAVIGGGLWYWRPWIERVEPALAERMAFPLPNKPSIVVLPFANRSGDPKQESIVDSLTEAIISRLSKSSRLFVIARKSSFFYKNKPVKVHQVSEELGVRYVLEGNFQRADDRIRVQAQLIDATSGYHIWSERYDRTTANIFEIQDDIAQNIAATIGGIAGQISLAERTRSMGKGNNNLDLWDHVRRGRAYFFQFKKDSNLLSRKEAMLALELDPKRAGPYASVGWTHLADVWLGATETPEKSYALAEEWALKAIAIDEKHHQGHYLLAYVHIAAGQFSKAEIEFKKALELAPNDAVVMYTYGMRYLVPVGRSEEALTIMRKSMRLNPHHMEHQHGMLAYPLYMLRRYNEAIATINRQTKPRIDVLAILAGSYAQLGQLEKARAVIDQIRNSRPDYTLAKFAKSQRFKNSKDAMHWQEGPRKAGLPE